MTILVTGARGGFGRSFVPKLLETVQENVVGVVRSGKVGSEIECNIADRSSVTALIRKTRPRIIYHMASSFDGDFENDVLVNAYSAKWIFDEILESKIDCRVVVFGSAAEYGLVSDGSNPVIESTPLNPVSVYGLTKVIQTQIATYYSSFKGVDLVVARIFNLAIEGLSERLFYGRIFSLINSYLIGEIKKLTFGNLESIRDYVDLDTATSQLLAITDRGAKGNIYNVASGVPIMMKDLLLKILMEHNVPLDCYESISDVHKLGTDVPVIYADISKVSDLVR